MKLSHEAIERIAALSEGETPMAMVQLIEVVEGLSMEEKAELMALMWTGRDGGDFAKHLKRARKLADNHVGYYMAEQGRELGGYLRGGAEGAEG